jgi:hypothetical protein
MAVCIMRRRSDRHTEPPDSVQSFHIMTRRPVLLGTLACLLFLIAQTYLWSWKTSGVLRATEDWNTHPYPWGYSAVTNLRHIGEWPMSKENFIYIQHHQAFLGVRDQYVRPSAGFEHLRALYAYLTQGLWFLGPIFSGIVLNVALWACACLSAAYVARSVFPHQTWTPWVAVLLTLSGQGFLDSVGEVSPHVLGYGVGFWVAAYVCAKRLWRADSREIDHLLVHGLVGVLKLGYEAAWFSYPFLILISYYASVQKMHRPFSAGTAWFLARCSLFSLGPGALMILVSRPFGATDTVSGALLLLRDHAIAEVLVTYVTALADSLLSFGPFMLALLTAGLVSTIRARDRFGLALAGTIGAMLVATAVVLAAYPARGYSTFGLALPLFLIAIRGYSWIWERPSALRYAAPALMAGYVLWSNAPLLGFKLPLVGFSWGYIHVLTNGAWQAYHVIQLR